MSDYITISSNPRYNSVYKRLKPGERRKLENFNGERYLDAVRGKKTLSIVTRKLNPRMPATLTRVMENFGSESEPLLVDVRAELSGPKGDLIVYIDKAKYHDDVMRAVFVSGEGDVVQRVYKSFAHMRKDNVAMKLIKRILNLK